MVSSKQVPLSEACWFQEGPGVRNWQFTTSGVKLLNVGNITKDGTIDLDKTDKHISLDEAEGKYSHFLVDEGDLVIASSGISFDEDGMLRTRGAFIEKKHLPLCLNTSTIRFKAIDGVSDLNFFKFWLDSFEFRDQVSRLVTGSAQQNFGPSHLKAINISLPPLTEQKRIASLLARADRLRYLRRTAHDLSESLLQSVFLEMFGDLSANPKGWDIATLEDLETDFIYGTSQKCFSEPKGYPVLRIPNVLHSKIDLDDLKYAEVPEKEAKNILLKHGDIIFVRTNGNPDYVGRCAVFNLDKDFLFASYLIRARLDLSRINPVFLLTFLQTAKGREAMAPYIRTTAGQSNIGIEGLGQIPVPLPPLNLQEEFARVVARVESLRGRMSEAERQVEGLFEVLLSEAFNA